MENYAVLSIETHLFFARIMKEHALFLEAGFPCKDKAWIQRADWFRQQFEALLGDVVRLADGRVGDCILDSGEVVTEFTIPAERKTEHLSGIPIDSRISRMQQRLNSGYLCEEGRELNHAVGRINKRALELLNGLIRFKEDILQEVGKGRLFTANYPLLIEHILREARLYKDTIEQLQNGKVCSYQGLLETEQFWNQIMMEHALFIRGLLDPTEEELIDTADDFAEEYKRLLEMAKQREMYANDENINNWNNSNWHKQNCYKQNWNGQNLNEQNWHEQNWNGQNWNEQKRHDKDWYNMDELTRASLEETLRYRDFKAAGAEGILENEIASIILPLLADHVLREANHYIRLLSCKE